MGVEVLLGVRVGVDIGDTRLRGTIEWSDCPSRVSAQRENTLSGGSLLIKSKAVPAEPMTRIEVDSVRIRDRHC